MSQDAKRAGRIYLKRAGPLVGILNGNFEPSGADKILGGIEFSYAVQWIYDRNNRRGEVVWGVPTSILGTVVRSIAFVAMLAGLSLLAGAALALFRVWLRTYAPHNYLDRPERTEMIRLKINEN
jgi:hypothetical protein